MLDFSKLIEQIGAIGQEALTERTSFQALLTESKRAYDSACQEPIQLANRLERDSQAILWPVALPLEPFGQLANLPNTEKKITVIAADGSQIMPSQHEIHQCFLLNIGFVQIAFGSETSPILTSFPHLYHRPEDLYPLADRRRYHIDELYVSLERSLLEYQYLADKLSSAKKLGQQVVALLDGSLIAWSLEKMPEAYQKSYIERCHKFMQVFKDEQTPIIGYISHSRAADVVNDLRVAICPFEQSHCREHCGHLNEESFPCSTIWPLADRIMFEASLPDRKRTNTFLSGANVSKLFTSDFRICFCYIRTKDEIVRLEFPQWLFRQTNLFDTALGAVLDQVEKGMGYPVSLAEAHHLAVIKGADREKFFDLLSRHLVSIHAGPVQVSPKERKKRVGFV